MLFKHSFLLFAFLTAFLSQTTAQVQWIAPATIHTNPNNSLYVGPLAPTGNNIGDPVSYELEVDGRSVNDGLSGAIYAKSNATGPSCVGSAEGYLGLSSSFNAAGNFFGARGNTKPSFLDITVNTKVSAAAGGYFQTDVTGLSFGAAGVGTYYVGGSWNVLSGVPNNYSPDGIMAAVIGSDRTNDGVNTWAGYFEGRSYFSDKVGIGTKNVNPTIGSGLTSNYKLFVKGGILTEQLLVYSGALWPDYVFAKGYKLEPLEAVEQHIAEVGHLPNTPSAAEVEANGINVGDHAINQQEKIEELFLYVIQLNKDVKALQAENQALKAQLNLQKDANHGK